MSKYNYHNSSYYPPRANWLSKFYYIWTKIRTDLGLDRISLPALDLYPLVLSVLLPGFGFICAGKKAIGRVVLCVYFSFVIIFVVFAGKPLSNLAFAWLIFLHTSGIIYAQLTAMHHYSIMRRAFFGVIVAIFGILFYYLIGANLIYKYLFKPFIRNDMVLVVSKLSRLSDVKRGDFVAYRIYSSSYNGAAIYGRFSVDRVIAIGGDHIKFTPAAVLVNGEVIQRFDYFPTSGEIVLPEKCLFVVPSWRISIHNLNINIVREFIFDNCIVDEGKFIGKAPRRWLGLRQYY